MANIKQYIFKHYPALATEECVFYFCHDADRWVAHGTQTNQIGTGSNIYKAFDCFVENVMALEELNCKQGGILEIHRAAPPHIMNLLKDATPISEILDKRNTRRKVEEPAATLPQHFSHDIPIRTMFSTFIETFKNKLTVIPQGI